MDFCYENTSSCSSVGSTFSDFRDYLSSDKLKNIDKIFKNVVDNEQHHMVKQWTFTPSTTICTKHFSHKLYNTALNKIVNKQRNVSLCIELIKYYNKYNCLNSSNSFRFIELLCKRNSKAIVKKLTINNVNNIKSDCKFKYLYTIACQVRNKHLRRQLNIINAINSNKSIFNKLTKITNRFDGLDVQEGECYAVPEDDDHQTYVVKPRINTRFLENETVLNNIHKVYKETVIPIRDVNLSIKLRNIIKYLSNLRKRKQYREDIELMDYHQNIYDKIETSAQQLQEALDIISDSIPSCSKDIRPEMMEPESTTQQQEAGPVVLNTIEQSKVVVPSQVDSDRFWVNNSTSDAIVDIKHASQMEILIDQFEWKTSMPSNYEIFSIDLPVDAISKNMAHPAAMMFGQYAYWHGDMKVTIHINTTPFHVGKLIFAWYYGQQYDDNQERRMNIASAIQLPNVCFSASQGGDAILEIPYRNYRSMICTRRKADDSLNFYLGTLTCLVFNPLTADAPTSVTGYVHLSMLNSSFTGICPRRDVQAEMMPTRSLIKATEGTLHTLDRLTNMDKPSLPEVPKMYTPQFSDSFATGVNDLQNVHSLRIDPCGQTPHPSGSSIDNNETSLYNIARRWGFLKTITWKTSMSDMYKMYSLPVTPELPFDNYYHVNIKNTDHKNVVASVLPPVSALCCINAYNRGSIDIKIEIINSRYHTGALLASFTPVLKNVTFLECKQSYNSTMDVGNIDSYIFKIPYINERPYNPRYNTSYSRQVRLAPIGEFNLHVLNILRAATGVSDHVYVNLYMRAGDDFEFAVPVAPLYSVALDTWNHDPDVTIWPLSLNKAGMATWRYMDAIVDRAAVMKYGTGDDSILQFNNMQPFTVYKKDWKDGAKIASNFAVGYYSYDGKNAVISPSDVGYSWNYVAMFIVNGDGIKYSYGIAFYDEEVAKSYVKAHYSLVTEDNMYPNSPTIKQWYDYDTTNKVYYPAIRQGASDSYREITGNASLFTYKRYYTVSEILCEMDIMSDPTISMLPSTMNGLRLFGEQFKDIKDYMRRYQVYASPILTMSANTYGKFVRIPMSYLATSASSKINGHIRVITREGLIPYLLSAFRYGRGGMRLKIVITGVDDKSDNRSDEVYYIQHKPDLQPDNRDVFIEDIKADMSAEYVLTSGYAYTALSAIVNNAITVEIPCYIPTNMLMLQAPNMTRKSEILHYFMGVLDIYLPFTKPGSKYNVAIHYAMADDFQVSDFVGFPPMVPLYQGSKDNSNIIPEMGKEKPLDVKPSTSNVESSNIEEIPTQPELNMFGKLKNSIKKKVDNFTKSQIRTTLNLPEASVDDSIGSIIKDVLKKFGEDYKHEIVSIIGQLVQCILNPELSTFIVCIVVVLSHLGLNSWKYLPKIGDSIKKMFSSNVEGQMDAGVQKTENTSEEEQTSFIRTLIDLSASTFGKSVEFVKSLTIPDFTKGIFLNIRMGALTINTIVQLLKNVVTYVPMIFAWLGRVINPKQWYRWLFADRKDFLYKWLSDVEFATDPNNLEEMRSSYTNVMKVELLVMIGRDVARKQKYIDSHIGQSYFNNLIKKLDNLYRDIVANNITAGSIGTEPFCLCLDGDSHVGKTYVTKSLSASLLKQVNYQTNKVLFFTRNNAQYWDGLANQPICIYDDFLHIKSEDKAGSILADFLVLKSKATFTPNFSSMDDKGKKYNPLILALTMNNPYEQFSWVAEPTAWMNRRDIMINVIKRDSYQGQKIIDMPKDVIKKYEHLWFRIRASVNSVTNQDTMDFLIVEVPTEETIDKDPAEHIMEKISKLTFKQVQYYTGKLFLRHYNRMREEFLQDMELQMSFLPDPSKDFEDNIDAYRKYIVSNLDQMNARESETLRQAEKFRKSEKCNRCNNIMCMCKITNFNMDAVGELKQSVGIVPQGGKLIPTNEILKKMKNMIGSIIPPEIQNQVMQRTYREKAMLQFVEKECIHSLLASFRNLHSFAIEYIDGKYYITYPTEEVMWLLDDKDCVCEMKGQCSINSLVRKLQYLAFNQDAFTKTFLMENINPYQKLTKNDSYVKHLAESRKYFMEWLDEDICPSSWCNTIGAKLFKLRRPILAGLATIAALFLIKHNYSSIKTACSKKKNKQEANKLLAKVIEDHEVTEECIQGKCSMNICKIGEMAYTERIARQSTNPTPSIKVVGQMSTQVRTSVLNRLKRNTFFLKATQPNFEPVYCKCIGLRDKWFIGVDHYFDKLRAMPLNTKLEFISQNLRCAINFNDISMQKIQDSALYICKAPISIPSFINIVDRIVPSKSIPHLPHSAYLCVIEPPTGNEVLMSDAQLISQKITYYDDTPLDIPHIVDAENGKPTSVSAYYQYQTSGQGLCGSVLLTDMNIDAPIIGIHVAGIRSGGCGYSEVVCKETFENFFTNVDNRILDVEIEGQMFNGEYINFEQNFDKSRAFMIGDYDFMGIVPRKYSHNPPGSSKCSYSMCHNMITESTYDFPWISHRDQRFKGSPLVQGCLHHLNPVIPFEQKDLDLIVNSVKDEILAKVQPLRQRIGVLTREQAICGIPSIPSYDAMEFDTSEGFPFKGIRPPGAQDKKWLFDLTLTTEGYSVNNIHECLIDVLDRKQQQRENGIVPMTVFTDCLKDSKLPREKCHKTRIFSISPVDFTIQFRQYFYDFTIAFQESRFNIESAIGINVDSYEWHNMIQIMLKNSKNFVCGDYSKFGPRLMSSCVLAFFQIIIDWYKLNGDDSFINERIRWIMAHEIAFSNHLMLNMVYRVISGAPSGCPITTVLNNGVNMMYIRMAYYYLVCKVNNSNIDDIFKFKSIAYFKNFVSPVFYGDDLIMTVKDEILNTFNAQAISDFLNNYDIKFTDALKTGSIKNHLTLYDPEVSFLKRTTKRHEMRPIYVAAMDKRAIEETCNWVFKGHVEPEASVQACEAMLLNAFGHGSEYYTQLRNKVMNYWIQYNIVPQIPIWTEVDERIFSS